LCWLARFRPDLDNNVSVTKTRRGGTIASTQIGVSRQLRRLLLQFYDTDRDFALALRTLWTRRARRLNLEPDWRSIPPVAWVDIPSALAVRHAFEARDDLQALGVKERRAIRRQRFDPLGAYLDELAAMAVRFGLEALGDDGVDTIHAWCVNRQAAKAEGRRWPPRYFSAGYQSFGPLVRVGETVERPVGHVVLDGHSVLVVERDLEPIVRVGEREDSWDPALEPRAAAFARLRKTFGKRRVRVIRAEIDRLADQAMQAGARTYDTRPNALRDLRWLYWHLRYRESPAEVAKRARLRPRRLAMVRVAVWRIAGLAQVELHHSWTGWEIVPRDYRSGVR
jgi:hypothetical protein